MYTAKPRHRRAFTLTELLTVIAIIAILAAVLFPIFGTIREQARQSGTMSNMHNVYVAARMFNEDEGRFPNTLFGYAEVADPNLTPPFRPVHKPTEHPNSPYYLNSVPMNEVTGVYQTGAGLNRGYLFREQIKDIQTYLNSVEPTSDRKAALTVYWPVNSPLGAGSSIDSNGVLQNGQPVLWSQTDSTQQCTVYGDSDMPNIPGKNYAGQPKMYYLLDSMDIGPMLTRDGRLVRLSSGDPAYELHYTPDWTHRLGAGCDADANGNAFITQLKYKNPPRERTVLTYVTHHAAYSGSPYVLVLLANGTARKVNAREAVDQLPLGYK